MTSEKANELFTAMRTETAQGDSSKTNQVAGAMASEMNRPPSPPTSRRRLGGGLDTAPAGRRLDSNSTNASAANSSHDDSEQVEEEDTERLLRFAGWRDELLTIVQGSDGGDPAAGSGELDSLVTKQRASTVPHVTHPHIRRDLTYLIAGS